MSSLRSARAARRRSRSWGGGVREPLQGNRVCDHRSAAQHRPGQQASRGCLEERGRGGVEMEKAEIAYDIAKRTKAVEAYQ